eukprot:506173-Alexandrium_andersonii.AAC.1
MACASSGFWPPKSPTMPQHLSGRTAPWATIVASESTISFQGCPTWAFVWDAEAPRPSATFWKVA